MRQPIAYVGAKAFFGLKNVRIIFINASQVEYIQKHAFANLPELTEVYL
jgi:hypothetical protein